MITNNDILKLTKQLLPTGRAWRLPDSGVFKKMMYALGISEQRAYNFALGVLNRILPDNDSFTADDATQWERRLAINAGTGYIPLSTRKSSILRKMQFPGGFLNRQNYRYIEAQLQLAGYNVTITENYSDLPTSLPTVHASDTLHSSSTKHGGTVIINDIIANSINKGEVFYINTYKRCFYLDGSIPFNAIKAFRLLVLTLKPVDTVAILRLEYTNEKEFVFMSGDLISTVDGKQLKLVVE